MPDTPAPSIEPVGDLPAGWFALFDGKQLAEKHADAAILTTVDSENWAHTCFVSAGEVLAAHGRLYIALWKSASTAANLRSRPRSSLFVALDGIVWEARMHVRACEGVDKESQLLVFEGRLVGVRRHAAPYAHVRHLVDFTLHDREKTLLRWSEQIDLLRRVAARQSAGHLGGDS